MSRKNIFDRIKRYNKGRDPERLAMKLQAMQSNAFVFLRGTCHLFCEDLPSDGLLKKAPVTWICGDLHLENFGTYKGDNRLVYFDMNDFDEAVLAPVAWEVVRMVTSIFIGCENVGIPGKETEQIAALFLRVYTATLAKGKARFLEAET